MVGAKEPAAEEVCVCAGGLRELSCTLPLAAHVLRLKNCFDSLSFQGLTLFVFRCRVGGVGVLGRKHFNPCSTLV